MLDNKVCIITGSATGIGRDVALTLAENKCNIVVNYINESQLEAVKSLENELSKHGVEFISIMGSVTSVEDCKNIVEKTVEKFGKIDVLVNNAGITRDKLVRKMTNVDFTDVINVNLVGAFNMIKEVYPIMIKARTGSIINMSSVIGLVGNAGQANYAASKAGLLGLTKSIAKEVAPRNVRCNSVCPGFIETEMTAVLSDEIKQSILSVVPMKKYGSTKDIANAVLFLASDMSSYITGQEIVVDGGMVM